MNGGSGLARRSPIAQTTMIVLGMVLLLLQVGSAWAQTPSEVCAADSLYLISPEAIDLRLETTGRRGLTVSWPDMDLDQATCFSLKDTNGLSFEVTAVGGFGDQVDRVFRFSSPDSGTIGSNQSENIVVTWQNEGPATYGNIGGKINLTNNGGILRYNPGDGWTQTNTGLPMTWFQANTVGLDQGAGGFLVAGFTSGVTAESLPVGLFTFDGSNWAQIANDIFTNENMITAIAVSPLDNNSFAVGTANNGLYITTDGGQNFTQWTVELDPGYENMPSTFAVRLVEWQGDRVFVFLSQYGLFISQNNGVSFTRSNFTVPENLDVDPVETYGGFRIVRNANDLQQPDPIDLVDIPAGTFTMGTPADEPGRDLDEILHQVTLTRSFKMSKYEITEEQWDAVMGSGTSQSQKPKSGSTWYMAVEFCNELSQSEGLMPAYEGSGTNWTWNQSANGYRLPTEAEWEYACRAGSSSAFYNGPITELECGRDLNLDEVGWYCGNGTGETDDVGQKQPNAWGLYDMHGNVWEWCWDYYANVTSDPVVDPIGPATGYQRTARGGSAISEAVYCRGGSRGYFPPTSPVYILPVINALSFHPTDPDRLAAALNFHGAYESRDGGVTWQNLYGDLNVPDANQNGAWVHSGLDVVYDEASPGTMVMAVLQEGLYRTTNDGTNWVLVGSPVQPENPASILRVDLVSLSGSPGTLLALEDSYSLLQSTDSGATWAPLDPQPQIDTGYFLMVDADGSGGLTIGSWGGGLYVPGTLLPLADTYSTITSADLRDLDLGLDVSFSGGVLNRDDFFQLICQTFQGWAVWKGSSLNPADMTLIGLYDRVNPEDCFEGYCGDFSHEIVPNCFAAKRAACFQCQYPNFQGGPSVELPCSQGNPDDSDFSASPDTIRFFDEEIYNGFIYNYAVTSFDYGNTARVTPQNNSNSMLFSPRFEGDFIENGGVSPFPGSGNITPIQINEPLAIGEEGYEEIYVFPNPLRQDQGFPRDPGNAVTFKNIPDGSKILVFTTAGDRVIDLGPELILGGNLHWDTHNSSGESITSGVYLYKVEIPQRDEYWGRLVVIR